MGIVIAVLLLIVIVFGVSSGMQSYATAQQAQATIEVAQLGQINAWGNLVTILTVVMVLVVFVALAALVLWFLYKRSMSNRPRLARAISPTSDDRPQTLDLLSKSPGASAGVSVNELTQLMMLDMLRSMRGPAPLSASQPSPQIDPQGTGDQSELFHWLK